MPGSLETELEEHMDGMEDRKKNLGIKLPGPYVLSLPGNVQHIQFAEALRLIENALKPQHFIDRYSIAEKWKAAFQSAIRSGELQAKQPKSNRLDDSVIGVEDLCQYLKRMGIDVVLEMDGRNEVVNCGSEKQPRVKWQVILFEKIQTIDEAHNGKADVREAIGWLKKNGGDRILNEGDADELVWLDDNNTKQKALKKSVSNALSRARKAK